LGRLRRFLRICVTMGVIALIVFPAISFAEVSYDKYTPTWKYPKAFQPGEANRQNRQQFMLRILEQPIRPFGYGIGETAEWVERHHIDKKTIWFFDELSERGIHPKMRISQSKGTGPALELELDKLFKFTNEYFSLKTFEGAGVIPNDSGLSYDFGGSYRLNLPPEIPTYQETVIYYDRKTSQNFFGIGQNTSLGDWSTYAPEELKLNTLMGVKPTEQIEGKMGFVFQHMNIGNGRRERVGKIKEHFMNADIPGISGGDLIGLETSVAHDTRDHQDDPKKGGIQKLQFGYFHDVDSNDFQYLQFQGSLAHFFSLGSDRRVLALRFHLEKDQDVGNGNIPFYNLPRLGGVTSGQESELLRSYRHNRFIEKGLMLADLEYRYSIWEYGDCGADAFLLTDVGEVFKEFSGFGFEELKGSYGGGMNIKFRRKTVLTIVWAAGNEGSRLSMQTKASF